MAQEGRTYREFLASVWFFSACADGKCYSRHPSTRCQSRKRPAAFLIYLIFLMFRLPCLVFCSELCRNPDVQSITLHLCSCGLIPWHLLPWYFAWLALCVFRPDRAAPLLEYCLEMPIVFKDVLSEAAAMVCSEGLLEMQIGHGEGSMGKGLGVQAWGYGFRCPQHPHWKFNTELLVHNPSVCEIETVGPSDSLVSQPSWMD